MHARLYVGIRRKVGRLLFDRRYGVHTSGRVELSDLGLAHPDRVFYIATKWRRLSRILQRYQITPEDVFVDLGSGMGRMVLEASRFPFKRVIGVELASELHGIAEENVRRMRRSALCAQIELVNSDVVDYTFPDDVTFVYMFNPFQGAVFRHAIDNLLQSLDRNPRTVHVIYRIPVEEPYLLSTGRFRLEADDNDVHLYRSVDRTATQQAQPSR